MKNFIYKLCITNLMILLIGCSTTKEYVTSNTSYSTSNQEILFLNKENATDYLLKNDDFFQAMNSCFDASIRLEKDLCKANSDSDLTMKKLKEFVSEQTLNWDKSEINQVLSITESIQKSILSKSEIILQDTLYFIKTTGKEEFKAFYTSRKAIVVPKKELSYLGLDESLDNVFAETIAHELLHIATRNNIELKEKLYSIIGFLKNNITTIDSKLEEIRITNPDFYDLNYSIELGEEKNNYCLVTYSKYPKYDGKKGLTGRLSTLMGYLKLGLFKIDNNGLLTSEQIEFDEEFYQKAGRISEYKFGADEIVAEAFRVLITESNWRTNDKYSERDIEILNQMLDKIK